MRSHSLIYFISNKLCPALKIIPSTTFSPSPANIHVPFAEGFCPFPSFKIHLSSMKSILDYILLRCPSFIYILHSLLLPINIGTSSALNCKVSLALGPSMNCTMRDIVVYLSLELRFILDEDCLGIRADDLLHSLSFFIAFSYINPTTK